MVAQTIPVDGPTGGPRRLRPRCAPAASPLPSRAFACARSFPSILIGGQVGVLDFINRRKPLAKSACILYIYHKLKEAGGEISAYTEAICEISIYSIHIL